MFLTDKEVAMARWRTLVLTSGIFFALGCSRPVSTNSTKITIRAPSSLGKIGAMAAMPAGPTCYAFNVSGPGISPKFATIGCGSTPIATGLDIGLFSAFVLPGAGDISLEVPQGSGRKIELFAYFPTSGQCDFDKDHLTKTMLANTYKVGSVENVVIQGTQQIVEITANYPGNANHLAANITFPATCSTASAPSGHGGFHISTGMQEATGTGFKLKARIGSIQGAKTLSNANYKLYVK